MGHCLSVVREVVRTHAILGPSWRQLTADQRQSQWLAYQAHTNPWPWGSSARLDTRAQLLEACGETPDKFKLCSRSLDHEGLVRSFCGHCHSWVIPALTTLNPAGTMHLSGLLSVATRLVVTVMCVEDADAPWTDQEPDDDQHDAPENLTADDREDSGDDQNDSDDPQD